MTVRISFSKLPFYRYIVNRGFQYWDNSGSGDPKLVKAVDANDKPISEPVLLAANGTKLGAVVGNTLRYRVREEVSYQQLQGWVFGFTNRGSTTTGKSYLPPTL